MFALGNKKTSKKLENLAISQNIINTLKLYQESIATNALRLKEKMHETKKIRDQQITESSKEDDEICNCYAMTAAAASATSFANSYINAPSIGFNGVQLLSLYNIPSIKPKTLSNGKMAKKVKIAIIIAYTYPKLKDDLYQYWTSPSNFGPNSTPPNVTVYTTPGATVNNGWSSESCLDLQIMCTINPNADIYVVEAKTGSTKDMMAAVKYAENYICADVISMSWGGNDSSSFSLYSSSFSNPNICYCAASGDTNYVSWPAVSSNCIAVGGTTLLWTPTDVSPTSRTEFTWPSAGCGYSKSVLKPAYQNAVNPSKYRCIPDLSLVSNPTSGIHIVYNGKWDCIGGTSAAAPIFAAMLSIANQQRFNSEKPALTTVYSKNPVLPTNVQECLYNPDLYNSMFTDVVIGTCEGTDTVGIKTFSAVKNFDPATGLGSPNCAAMCDNLFNL